jgi:diketogulonate reductase-like aldo/keto reductase
MKTRANPIMDKAPTATMVCGSPFPSRVYGTAFREGHRPPNIHLAAAAGYRVIDTSSTRKSHNERIDGQQLVTLYHDSIMAVTRSEIFLQTKFTPRYAQQEPLPFDVLKDPPMIQVLKSALRSAEDLQTEFFDMYLLHYPMENGADTLEVWRAMEAMHDRNAARYLGLCHANPQYLQWLWDCARVKPSAIQNRFSKDTRYDEEVIRFCQIHGIIYQAFGVFADDNQDLLSSSVVLGFAKKHSVSSRQALSSLLIAMYASDGIVFCIVDGTSDPKHMKENLTGDERQFNVTDMEVSSIRAKMKEVCERDINP